MADGMTHLLSDRLGIVREDIDSLTRLALEMENEISRHRWNEKARAEGAAQSVAPPATASEPEEADALGRAIEAAIRAGTRLEEARYTRNERAAIDGAVAASLALGSVYRRRS